MNLANKLTLTRIVFAFLFLIFLLNDGLYFHIIALVLVVIAMLTDLFDGRIARQRHMVTNIGKLMDPLADKILITAAFIAFVELGLVSSWMVVVIISREFCITGLRLIASSKGKIISASRSGKHKTISQMVSVLVIIVLIISRDILVNIFSIGENLLGIVDHWFNFVILLSMLVTVCLTVISGYIYINENVYLFEE